MAQNKTPSVIIVDDEPGILRALQRVLADCDVKLQLCDSASEALTALQESNCDLIISDQRMPITCGTELLQQAAQISPQTQRVLLSGYADFDAITQAFNDGTLQRFISKPWQDHEIIHLVESLRTSDKQTDSHLFHQIWSQDSAMQAVFQQIKKAALANAPVFIFGETGTGKEMVARALHLESCRAQEPFIAFNCANFSESLMESQLFGHQKGAFTGAHTHHSGLLSAAGQGTLFLDETTSLNTALQSKLLRVLQEREFSPLGSHQLQPFNGQVISASSQSLADAVAEGNFRPDLRYRLEVIPINLPPLRQRRGDIVPLFLRFLDAQRPQDWQLQADTLTRLQNYPWPGNIRQLINCAQYVSAMAENSLITPNTLPDTLFADTPARHNEAAAPVTEPTAAPINAIADRPINTPQVSSMDAEQLLSVLADNNNNRTHAARALGVSRMTLWRRLKALNIE